jgi:hypothetical protein
MTKARAGHPSILKPKVEEVLDQGGAYIVFTTQELNTKQKYDRIAAVRKRIAEQGKEYSDTCAIYIYDAAQIAGWVNNFIPTIVSVLHWVGRPIERGLKTIALWGEHEDLNGFPFVAVKSRENILSTLAESISEPKSCFRIMGLSGLGKTRTAFHAFSESEIIRNIVVYVDANHAPAIDALVADWVSLGFQAILVVDNCEYRLHERLVKEVRRENSRISLLSLDYNLDSVSPSTICFKLEPMSDEELLQLLNPIYQDQLPDLDRIVRFAQGFPQMAVLLAEARLADDPLIGQLNEDELANKLLWGRNGDENPEYLKILQACSLFDVFGIEKEAEEQLEYISGVIGLDIDNVFACVQKYSDRGLIDRRGRFGQVVPKPLAIRLAAQWWTGAREKIQQELVDGIPERMVGGFCDQVEKLDYHPNVKALTEKLCGPQRPFGQAEVILSTRGSRLFRAFVIVNPEATSNALYEILVNKPKCEIQKIDGEVRRNLVRALERLCYHTACFEKSAWCMLLLAVSENESWSNNATGIFAQLFRIQLSGTAATPAVRFKLLKRALALESGSFDMVVLEALHEAISTYGGSKIVGAEHQGSKPPLEDWRPAFWQEIFDYWQEAFDLLLQLFRRGEGQKEKVLSDIGNSIRGFVSQGRLEMLDTAIRTIVAENGIYWPPALDSIKNTFEYDSLGMKREAEEALNDWIELLNPENAELSVKLRIIVIDPPWEARKGDDGKYIDMAAENAKRLGTDLAANVDELIPCLEILLDGDQRQTVSFGRHLALNIDIEKISELISLSLGCLINRERPNPNFVYGLLRGLFEKQKAHWQLEIDKLLNDDRYAHLYPDFVSTGDIEKTHLDVLLELIRQAKVPYDAANVLKYGGVIDSVGQDTISDFCLSLAGVHEKCKWSALDVIYSYCFSNKASFDPLRQTLKTLVTTVSLHRGGKDTHTDSYRWKDIAEKLLKVRDEDLALSLTNQLIAGCKYELDHSDIWNYLKPLLLDLMRGYGDILWPVFGDAIVDAKGIELYWLQQLLDRENSFSNKLPSVLSVVPAESVIAWCQTVPDRGPGFVAKCVNVFDIAEDDLVPSLLFISLLENFGDNDKVKSALNANMGTRGWSGSLVPYLEADKSALTPLLASANLNVCEWVSDYLSYIDSQIAFESMRDDEQQLGIY